MTETFTDALRRDSRAAWDRAVDHRFVRELVAGTVDDAVMAGYLVPDHRFLDGVLAFLGAAVATADTVDARIRLARFAGLVAGDENTYFLRAFDALGVSSADRERIPDAPATMSFIGLLREAAASADPVAIPAVLVVSERLYADWAVAAYKSRTLDGLRDGQAALAAILAEAELLVALLSRRGIGREEAEAAPERPATAAYTRDALADGPTGPRRRRDLLEVFRTATRLEAAFWQQSLAAG